MSTQSHNSIFIIFVIQYLFDHYFKELRLSTSSLTLNAWNWPSIIQRFFKHSVFSAYPKSGSILVKVLRCHKTKLFFFMEWSHCGQSCLFIPRQWQHQFGRSRRDIMVRKKQWAAALRCLWGPTAMKTMKPKSAFWNTWWTHPSLRSKTAALVGSNCFNEQSSRMHVESSKMTWYLWLVTLVLEINQHMAQSVPMNKNTTKLQPHKLCLTYFL